MRGKSIAVVLACALVFGLGVGLAHALGQAPPKDASIADVVSLDLTAEDLGTGKMVPDLAGRSLRMRLITRAPGYTEGPTPHSHAANPGLFYVLKGTLTDKRGGAGKDYAQGTSFSVGKQTMHFVENNGKEPVQYLVIDIFKP